MTRRKINPATLPELHIDINSHNTRGKNPAPRRGTSKPRRVSQITKKPLTRRLVKRREKNTDPGYFPNPLISQKAVEAMLRKTRNAVSHALLPQENPLTRQAHVSYAQGMVEAAETLKLLKPGEASDLLSRIESSMR